MGIDIERIANNSSGLRIPQGMTEEEFRDFSANIIRFVQDNNLPEGELLIHGSRAKGTASETSDIDIMLRVDQNTFDIWAEQRLSTIWEGTKLYKSIVKARKKQKLSKFDISKDFSTIYLIILSHYLQ